MSCSALSLRSPVRALAVLAVLLVPSLAAATDPPIIQVYDDSLTTYLPSSASAVQDVRPLAAQRGVGIDGALWARSTLPISFAANPQGSPWIGKQRMGDIRLDLGTYSPTEIDMALPATIPWVIGRTYNPRQAESNGTHRNNLSYQGVNWFQTSQPEIVLYEHPTDDTKDVLYVILGNDRYIELKRQDDGEDPPTAIDEYKAVNGAAGIAVFSAGSSGEPDTFTYYDQNGTAVVFFGFNNDAGAAAGQIWKIVGTGGDVAYVGDATTGSTAITNGYDANGHITYAHDSNGVRFAYVYTTILGYDFLSSVTAAVNTGSWTTVETVEYEYYQPSNDTEGGDGALELVTRTVPMSSGDPVEYKTYYRYDDDYFLSRVLKPEGARQFDYTGDSDLDEDFLTADDGDLTTYWALSLTYDGSHRIDTLFVGGAGGGCGCGGGSGSGSGAYTLTYGSASGFMPSTGYQEEAATYTRIEEPLGRWQLQYFDETGAPLTYVVCTMKPLDTLVATDKAWITYVGRWASSGNNPGGSIKFIAWPSHQGLWDNDDGSFATSEFGDQLSPYDSGNELDGQPQTLSVAGFSRDTTLEPASLTSIATTHLVRAMVSSREDFEGHTTSYTYAYHSGGAALRPLSITETKPTITTATNGSNSPLTALRYMRADGTAVFSESTDGIWSYTRVEQGLVTERRMDAKLDGTFPSGDDPNTNFGITESSAGLNLTTTYTYDRQGRSTSTTLPSGRETAASYTSLADGRIVTLSVPKVSSGTYYGPATYTVTNQAGKVEAQGTIAFASGGTTTTAMSGWIDNGEDDPIGAVITGTLARLTTTGYDGTGTEVLWRHAYTDISTPSYDTTTYDYDAAGHLTDVTDPTGTITETVYDEIGRRSETKTGTSSGNLVTVSELEYDNGSDRGDSLVTSQTVHVDGSTTRVTSFLYDSHDRRVVTVNPTAPHEVVAYDDDNHMIARGLYSDSSGLTTSTSPLTTTTNRIGLTETSYDALGRAWKTTRHEIDPSDGSDDDSLVSETWRDAAGRVAKRSGAQLTKTAFDRIGRTTRVSSLATDNDSSYADAVGGPTGDKVMLEQQTYYDDATSNVLMRVVISRFQDDTSSTGPLDPDDDIKLVDQSGSTFGSDKINGRVQITAYWYDDPLERQTDSVAFGTYGGANFDRADSSFDSPPARSDTALRTTTTYDDDGTVLSTEDPAGTITKFAYDDLGRQTKVIRNYVYMGSGDDENQQIEYGYTNGLRTTYTAALPGGDQTTTYTYDASPANGSALYSKRLLSKVTYPDSSGSTDVVTYAYNFQGEQISTQDQAGNVVETEYDDAGRPTAKLVTTLAGGFIGDVRAIRTAYDDFGRASTVTQYDDDSSTSSSDVVDQVGFSYNDWGLLENRDQDFNSEIDATGSVDHWRYSLAYEKATGGPETLRVTDAYVDYTDSTEKQHVSFTYGTSGSIDDHLSRVTAVSKYTSGSPVTIAEYSYLGVGQLVGTDYVEPSDEVFSHVHGTTSGSYPGLDNFNRVVSSVWSKDVLPGAGGPIDFYDDDISYDRVSNVTLVQDNVYTGWDTDYTMDGLNRLTDATSGTWSGSAITSTTRQEVWELDQAGNWDRNKLDLNGDGDFVDTNEFDVTGTFNDVNEQTVRGTWHPTYNAVGEQTDNGASYGAGQTYKWDAFGRLCQVWDKQITPKLIAQYRYNGLGERIAWQYDVDGDGTVETSGSNDDPWFYFLQDDHWRTIATITAIDNGAGTEAGEYLAKADDDPKELYVFQAAGLNGQGASSYVDAVILRDADMNGNGGWGHASDGTLEQRSYYCQNWRADVVALLDETGARREGDRYFAYGMPFGIPRSDVDGDGDVDGTDYSLAAAAFGTSVGDVGYDVKADVNLDGTVDVYDTADVSGDSGHNLGRGNLSRDPTLSNGIGNRLGYAGYRWDPEVDKYHARYRVIDTLTGRWLSRDPIGYTGDASLYEYVWSEPIHFTDPSGMIQSQVGCVPYQSVDSNGEPQNTCSFGFQPGGSRSNPGASPEVTTCNHIIQTGACASNGIWGPTYQQLAAALASECAGHYASGVPPISCKDCSGASPDLGGQTNIHCNGSLRSQSITICANRDPANFEDSVCEVTVHEMQHALDNCRRGLFDPSVPCPSVGIGGLDDCIDEELRAYTTSRACSGIADDDFKASCLCQAACSSCSSWWSPPGNEGLNNCIHACTANHHPLNPPPVTR